ncbi:hypothetical protein KUTG_02426 [Kutzneria sp. 744]|nr:hypothetical protein KUTG_02426 [Kutzneria sp. 744]
MIAAVMRLSFSRRCRYTLSNSRCRCPAIFTRCFLTWLNSDHELAALSGNASWCRVSPTSGSAPRSSMEVDHPACHRPMPQ